MKIATAKAAVRMRCAFCSRAFSVSTNTHSADRVPRTPNVACAKSMTSLAVTFTADLRFPAASVPTLRADRRCSSRLSLSGFSACLPQVQ